MLDDIGSQVPEDEPDSEADRAVTALYMHMTTSAVGRLAGRALRNLPGQARAMMSRGGKSRHDGRMIDLILRNARMAGQETLTDLGVDHGEIVAVGDDTTAAEIVDLAGRLVTPPLVEPHIHLDAVLTVGQPRPNVSGSLFEGIAVWAERVADLTYEDVQSRVRQVLRWQLASGVQHVRSHVDVCDPQLRALRALVDLREEVRGLIDVQLVAFPQQGILGYEAAGS